MRNSIGLSSVDDNRGNGDGGARRFPSLSIRLLEEEADADMEVDVEVKQSLLLMVLQEYNSSGG